MKKRIHYCPISEECNKDILIEPNSYFLIEPFDELKDKREKEIWSALKTYYSNFGIEPKLDVSDLSDPHLKGLYCSICSRIKSSEYCIVDVTGELIKIINTMKKREEKIFLRSNVAFELGLAYGFNKPTFVLSRKLKGKREFLSDIKFIQYIDIEGDQFFESFYDALCQNKYLITVDHFPPGSDEKEAFRETLRKILTFKKSLPIIKEKSYFINEITWDNNKMVGIVSDSKQLSINGSKDLFVGICFDIYISKGNFEKKIGRLQVDSITSKGLAQVSFYNLTDCDNTYLNEIGIHLSRNISEIYSLPDEHRLELKIEEQYEKIIDHFEIDQLEIMISR